MPLLARDVMQTHLITVGPDLPLVDAHRLFVEEEIHGAPVVEETGRVVGVITSTDLLRAVHDEHEVGGATSDYFRGTLEYSGPDWLRSPEDFQDRLSELSVADAMTAGGVTVAPDTPIPDVAGRMHRHRIHRVLVTEGDALAGIISSFDLIELLEKKDR